MPPHGACSRNGPGFGLEPGEQAVVTRRARGQQSARAAQHLLEEGQRQIDRGSENGHAERIAIHVAEASWQIRREIRYGMYLQYLP